MEKAGAEKGETTITFARFTGRTSIALDGAKRTRLFSLVAPGRLSLDSLSLQNGYDKDMGGVFHNDGGTLEAKGCVFLDNRSDFVAGMIYNRGGGNATFTDCTFDCTFRGNSAKTSGSVFYNAGSTSGGTSTLTAIHCLLEGNSGPAVDSQGGSTVNLARCHILRNGGSNNTGAIVNLGTLNLSQCLIAFNSSTSDSGAINNGKGVCNAAAPG